MENTMTTYTKKKFDPLSPDISLICKEDIAHALSMMTRANGHFPQFHSVAQHCINCCAEAEARGLSDVICFSCLLHDASEAYIADIIRPVKPYIAGYTDIEKRLQETVYRKFIGRTLTTLEEAQVKLIDNVLLYHEFTHFMGEEAGEKGQMLSEPDFGLKDMGCVEKRFLELMGYYMERMI